MSSSMSLHRNTSKEEILSNFEFHIFPKVRMHWYPEDNAK